MTIHNTIKSLLAVVFGIILAFDCNAASSLFSNYGQIQNVQNYSSNPFWNPNSPYNGSVPRPVYAQGTDLKTEDCMNVVQSLVAVQCMVRDNCKNTKLSEIRPEIMVQLSKLPNHNYASACAGYIDGVYEKYVEYYGNNAPTNRVAFPTGTTTTNNNIQIENPYKQQPSQWQIEINERSQELEELQRQNGADSAQLSATNFPATYADLSFSERIANEAAGLEPYKDLSAYRELNVQTTDDWCTEHSNAPGCSKQKKNGGSRDGNKDGNENGDITPPPTPTGHLIAARIHKRHMLSWGDGKTGTSGRGCFAICDVDSLTDNLNGKALYPVLNKRYCADKNRDGLLVDESDREPLQMTQSEFDDVKQKILSLVADQDQCDGHFRNHIMQVGYFYSGTSDFTKTEEIYLDD